MARKSEKPKFCECGKLIRNINVKRCSTCSFHYRSIKKTVQAKFMSEEEINTIVLERTRRFRISLPELGNGK